MQSEDRRQSPALQRLLAGFARAGSVAAELLALFARAAFPQLECTMLTVNGPDVAMNWSNGIDTWHVLSGKWRLLPDNGRPTLLQEGREPFNVIVAPTPSLGDVDATVIFKPIAGQEDASGGIVFRFHEGRYYVIRANALENNFRLYAYDRSRTQLAGAMVIPPELGKWTQIRIVAVGERIQGYLDGHLLIDHRDARFAAGKVGLWTKADSVTAFDGFQVRGAP